MSALASGHDVSYKVIDPTPEDLGVMVVNTRVVQKFREAESKGGPGQSGIVFGANTNLGSKWFIKGTDRQGRLATVPLNGRDILGTRYLPRFKVDSLFRLDADQP